MIFVTISLGLVAQSVRRLAFVIKHNGPDCASCVGSPVAFLMAWGTELFVLALALLVSWLAWRYLRHVAKAMR